MDHVAVADGEEAIPSSASSWITSRVRPPTEFGAMLGEFDLILPPGTSGVGGRGSVNTAVSQEFATPLPKALEGQLGLRLKSAKVPVEYLVVDHIEKATEN